MSDDKRHFTSKGIPRPMIPRALLRSFFQLLYTHLAWAYDFVAWLASAGYWYRWVLAALPFIEEGPVLEVGCGRGRLLAPIADADFMVVGVDGSPQMAARARHASGQPVICADGRALPFRDGHFASIVTTFPAPYILEEITQLEFARVVRREGRWIWIDAPTLEPVPGTVLARMAARLAHGRADDSALPPHLLADQSKGGWDARVQRLVMGPTTIAARVARRTTSRATVEG